MDILFKATRNRCMCKRKTVVRNVCLGKESRREGEKGNRNRQDRRHMSVRLPLLLVSAVLLVHTLKSFHRKSSPEEASNLPVLKEAPVQE